MSVALIREDTDQVVLTLDGVVSGQQIYDGRITDRALSDRSTRTDGRKLLPRTLSLSGRVNALVSVEGQLQGAPRVQQVFATLRELQKQLIGLTVQFEGRAGIPSMGVESFSEGYDRTTDAGLDIRLKEVRTATSRTVLLAAQSPQGTPTDTYAPGLEETAEAGERPTSALVQVGQLIGIFQ